MPVLETQCNISSKFNHQKQIAPTTRYLFQPPRPIPTPFTQHPNMNSTGTPSSSVSGGAAQSYDLKRRHSISLEEPQPKCARIDTVFTQSKNHEEINPSSASTHAPRTGKPKGLQDQLPYTRQLIDTLFCGAIQLAKISGAEVYLNIQYGEERMVHDSANPESPRLM